MTCLPLYREGLGRRDLGVEYMIALSVVRDVVVGCFREEGKLKSRFQDCLYLAKFIIVARVSIVVHFRIVKLLGKFTSSLRLFSQQYALS
jgi:hypothetical protein